MKKLQGISIKEIQQSGSLNSNRADQIISAIQTLGQGEVATNAQLIEYLNWPVKKLKNTIADNREQLQPYMIKTSNNRVLWGKPEDLEVLKEPVDEQG